MGAERLARRVSEERADRLVEAMNGTIEKGDLYIENVLVDIAPNMTAAAEGTDEHTRLLIIVTTHSAFLGNVGLQRVAERIEANKPKEKKRSRKRKRRSQVIS